MNSIISPSGRQCIHSKFPDSFKRQQPIPLIIIKIFLSMFTADHIFWCWQPHIILSPVMASTVGKEIKKKTKSLVIRLVLLTVYLTSGAAIFSAIENDGSLNEKQVEVNLKVEEIKRNMTRSFNASENIIELYVEHLRRLFQKHNGCRKYGHNNWSYYQSLYFAGSVTTTIGK